MNSPDQRPRFVSWGIALFVAIQIALPLSYYLGDGGHDERFAWRMFSPVRLAGCTVKAWDHTDGQKTEVRLGRELHVVWVNLLKRARTSVVDKAVKHLCASRAERGAPDIRLTLDCRTPDGVSLGVCIDARDANGDGIPDGYHRAPSCAGEPPEVCFQRDCQGTDITVCAETRCRKLILDGGRNLCVAEAS